MKKLFIALFIIIVTSCSKELIPTEEAKGIRFSVTVTMPLFENGSDETKSTISYVTRLNWKEGTDKISVINITKGKTLGGELSATSSGTTTTFAGSLSGTIETGDKLLFLFPSIGNESEEAFSNVTLDYSVQNGSSSSNVNIAAYATGTAEQQGSEMSVSASQSHFSFLMCYNYLALSNLPASSKIDEITIEGVPTKMNISWDYDADDISTESVLEYVSGQSADGSTIKTQTECITLSSSNWKTSASGQKGIYYTTPYVEKDTGFTRKVTVKLNDGTDSYSAKLSNTEDLIGYNYRGILSSFSNDNPTLSTLSISTEMPQLTSDEGVTAPSRAWQAGDEVSIVNLSTKKIVSETLAAQTSGTSTTLSGDVNMDEFSDGDKILLVYPKITNTNGTDFTTNEISYDLSTQVGSVESVPYVMTAEVTLHKFTSPVAEFEYQTAVSELTISGIYDYLSTSGEEVETTSITATTNASGAGNEGYGEESGAWDDATAYNIPVSKIKVSCENGIPTKLVIKYDSANGYAVSYETATSITLTQSYLATATNKDITAYFACPGVSDTSFAIYADIFAPTTVGTISNSSDSEYYHTEEKTISPIKGSFNSYSLKINSIRDNTSAAE